MLVPQKWGSVLWGILLYWHKAIGMPILRERLMLKRCQFVSEGSYMNSASSAVSALPLPLPLPQLCCMPGRWKHVLHIKTSPQCPLHHAMCFPSSLQPGRANTLLCHKQDTFDADQLRWDLLVYWSRWISAFIPSVCFFFIGHFQKKEKSIWGIFQAAVGVS